MKKWIKCAGIRAIKTMAQTVVASMILDVTIWSMDWLHILGLALTAGALSLITSVAGLPEVEEE